MIHWKPIEPLALVPGAPPPPPASLPVGTGGLAEIATHGHTSSVQSHFAFILASGAVARDDNSSSGSGGGSEYEAVAAAFMNALLSDEPNCLYVTCFTTRAHLTGGMTGLRPVLPTATAFVFPCRKSL
jgi:hypothetical protein